MNPYGKPINHHQSVNSSRRRHMVCQGVFPEAGFLLEESAYLTTERSDILQLNDSLKEPTPHSELPGFYGFLPYGAGCRPTR